MSQSITTQGMKLQFSATGGVKASGTVTLTSGLAAAESLTIAGHAFTFRASVPAADEAVVASTLALSAAALAHAINDSTTSGIAGVVTASASGAVVTVTAVAPGTGGNAITFTASGTHMTAITGSGFLSGGAGSGYQDIIEAKNINGPTETTKMIDVTHLGSTSREKRPALKDSGEITFTVNWIPQDDVHQALHTAIVNRTQDNYKIIYTDSPTSSATFTAYVTSHGPKQGLDDVVSADLTLTITGDVTYTPGA